MSIADTPLGNLTPKKYAARQGAYERRNQTPATTPAPEGNGEPQSPYAVPLPPSVTWKDRELYDGAELRRNPGRPGSMDAYNIPSKGYRC